MNLMKCKPISFDVLSEWGFPVVIQPKLDGIRCWLEINQGKVLLKSITGKEIISVPHINQSLENYIKYNYSNKNLILDGELYCHGMKFEDHISIVNRTVKLHDDREKIQFHCFDCIGDHKDNGVFHRLSDILFRNNIEDQKIPYINMVKTYMALNQKEIDLFIEKTLCDGYEGVIFRNWDAKYEFKRSKFIMKYKPTKHDCYKIIDFKEEISILNEKKDSLGAFIVEDAHGFSFSVGTGPILNKENRSDYWKNKEGLIGKYLIVKYQELSDKQIPRFPVAMEISNVYIDD